MATRKKSWVIMARSLGLLALAVLAGALYKNKVLETTGKVGFLKDIDKKIGENAGNA